MINANHVWGTTHSRAGVDASLLQKFEQDLAFSLPQDLKDLLLSQNGGEIVDEGIILHQVDDQSGELPLITKLLDGFGDDEILLDELEEQGFTPSQIIVIGSDDSGHTILGLNYVNGPESDPEVIWIDDESIDVELLADGFSEYISELLRVDEHPVLDLEKFLGHTLVAESSLPLMTDGTEAVLEQKLFETEGSFLLYVHEQLDQGEQMTLCEMMKPLDPDSCTIGPYRPEPNPSFQLSMSPRLPDDLAETEEDRILWINSRRTSRGWKNGKSLGVPLAANFEHEDRTFLEDLRRTLLGGEPSERALAEEQWQSRMDEISDEEMEGLFPQMMMQMLQQSESMVKDLDLGEPPAEIKDAFEHLAQLKAKIQNDIASKSSDGPELPADLIELMNQVIGMSGETQEEA